MTDISVVIVSYNTLSLTTGTLKALPDVCDDLSIEVIVVDNASTDGSAETLRREFPEVDVVANPTNLGFARAVNLAASRARGRYLLMVNPDIRPDGPFVRELFDYAEKHPSRGIYGGRPVHENGHDFQAGFAFPSLWGYLLFATLLSKVHHAEELPGLDRSAPVPVPALSGCVLMIDLALFRQLGGFDPRFFMYSEDVDLCWRATQAGAQPTLVPSARVVHLGGASSTSARKLEMLLKGKISFVNKHWPPGRAQLARTLLSIGVALRALLGREPWRTAWRTRSAWQPGWPTP